ncbi:MAG TPA: hypothetical protein VFH55_03715 [Nitrospiria bacterium]|nr:hypothetical protein [Nitrospiria bacterium]
MKQIRKGIVGFVLMMVVSISVVATSMAMKGGSPIGKMSKDELIKLAESAAPPEISKEATIMIPGPDGKLVEARKGTNGFTCIPDIDGQVKPDPFCGDAASMQWANDLMSNAPKPTNTVPGIAYMAQGGWHFEKDGKILMKSEPGAKLIKEPPHWMVFWAFDAKTTGLSAMPTKMGTYIMFEGSPYAHLMIYQDPKKMK